MKSANEHAFGRSEQRLPLVNPVSLRLAKKSRPARFLLGPWPLIETLPKLKIQLSSLAPTLSQFLIETKNAVLHFLLMPQESRFAHRSTARLPESASNHSKQSPGHASNHHKMPRIRISRHPPQEAQ
jgi:hypothetical protein